MHFGAPAFLLAMLFAAVPVILYILFRMRKRNVEWGATYVLQLTLRQSRRESRWRQYVVLALRTLALALLAGCGLVVAAMLVLAGGSWTRAGLLLAPLPVLGLGLWLASLPASARLLHRQRERLLHELVSD